MNKEIFFAYDSKSSDNKDAIKYGITEFNKHQKSYFAKTWEDLHVGGKILNSTVLSAIDDCEIFACDLSYLNHNVLFELGYAIGKGKKLLILLNPSIKNAKDNYYSSKILKNIGYDPFKDGRDLHRILQQKNKFEIFSIDKYINISDSEIETYDLLYLASAINNQASLDLSSYILGLDAKVIHNNTSEVEYQTFIWYINSIKKAKKILIHFLGRHILNDDLHNAEYSVFAGMGCGMNKKVMLIAPEPFRAPIDYSDILLEYHDSEECVAKTTKWLEQHVVKTISGGKILEEKQKEQEFNLLKLGIGYEVAEEEEDELLEYFIEIDSYKKVINRRFSIITGRKGTGKSALFIKLKDYFRNKYPDYFNIFLKPESDELIKNVELTRIYQNENTKRIFLYTVWKYVFFSNIFINICDRINAQDPATIGEDSLEGDIIRSYRSFKGLLELGPFGAMAKLYGKWNKDYNFRPETLEKIYSDIISPIRNLVIKYFDAHKFSGVNLLADNLDKTWDANSDLKLQAGLILSLLEFNEKIPHELNNIEVDTHSVLILRTDIFEYVLDLAREPDKLRIKNIEIDWSNYPQKLKDLLEMRFRYILDLDNDDNIDKIWKDYFRLNRKRIHPFDIIKEKILFRPRDIIYFVSKLFEIAVNRSHDSVLEDDLRYAINEYTNFLHSNMIAETKAQFPEIGHIIKEIKINYPFGIIEFRDLKRILKRFKYNKDSMEKFIDFLIGKNYLTAYEKKQKKVLKNFSHIDSELKKKKFFFFNKPEIFLNFILHRGKPKLIF